MNEVFDIVFKYTECHSIEPMVILSPFYKFIKIIDKRTPENIMSPDHVKIMCFFWKKLEISKNRKLLESDEKCIYNVIYFIYVHVVNDCYDITTHLLYGENTKNSKEFTTSFMKFNDMYFKDLFKINNDMSIIEEFWNAK